MHASQVILAPILSEKSYAGTTRGSYTFKVHSHAHKGARPAWKKAVVQLRAGDKIEIFEGAQL